MKVSFYKTQVATWYHFQLFPFGGAWFALFPASGSVSFLSFFLLIPARGTQDLVDSVSQNTQGLVVTNR